MSTEQEGFAELMNRASINTLLPEAMDVIEDYLNADCKEDRKEASKKAKAIYKSFHGKEYANRNERL